MLEKRLNLGISFLSLVFGCNIITFIILILHIAQVEKKEEIREELKESLEKFGKLRLILVA